MTYPIKQNATFYRTRSNFVDACPAGDYNRRNSIVNLRGRVRVKLDLTQFPIGGMSCMSDKPASWSIPDGLTRSGVIPEPTV